MNATATQRQTPQPRQTPTWFTRLLEPVRERLHSRLQVIHEELHGAEWRWLYLAGENDVRAITIATDGIEDIVMVMRDGETWPSMVIEITMVDRIVLMLGDQPGCVDAICSHLTIEQLC